VTKGVNRWGDSPADTPTNRETYFKAGKERGIKETKGGGGRGGRRSLASRNGFVSTSKWAISEAILCRQNSVWRGEFYDPQPSVQTRCQAQIWSAVITASGLRSFLLFKHLYGSTLFTSSGTLNSIRFRQYPTSTYFYNKPAYNRMAFFPHRQHTHSPLQRPTA